MDAARWSGADGELAVNSLTSYDIAMPTSSRARRGTAPVLGLAAAMAVVLAGAGPAHASDRSWRIVEVVPAGAGPAGATPARVSVRVDGVPPPLAGERDRWLLADADSGRRGIEPRRVIPFRTAHETLALVLLVEGHEHYVGNRRYTPRSSGEQSPTPVAGIYEALVSALDAPSAPDDEVPRTLRNAGPAGSQGALIVYAGTADVRLPMGDLRRLDGVALGAQELQRGRSRRDLAGGLRAAQAELRRVSAPHKALIVISDGVSPGGHDEITSIKRQLDRDHVEVVALHLELPSEQLAVDGKGRQAAVRVMKTLGGRHYRRVASPKVLASQLADAVRDPVNARFWLEFPGGPTPPGRLPRGPAWDGAEHQLVLLHDGEPFTHERAVAILPAAVTPGAGGGGWLWPMAGALGLGALVTIGVVARRRARRPAAAVAAPAQVDAGPVSWLIPIDGSLHDQPFRLDRPLTRLGTGDEADVRFNDPAVSRDHAAIERSDQGFVIVDRGSTNGTCVNQARVARRLLADNDVITLGTIRCRFRLPPA